MITDGLQSVKPEVNYFTLALASVIIIKMQHFRVETLQACITQTKTLIKSCQLLWMRRLA